MPSTPSTPATPHRRSRALGIRRPRVAGRTGPAPARPAEPTRREDDRHDDGRTVDLLAPSPGRPGTGADPADPTGAAGTWTVDADPAESETVESPTAESETVESRTAGSRTAEFGTAELGTAELAARTQTSDRTAVHGSGPGAPAPAARPSGKRDRRPGRLPTAVRTRRRVPTLVLAGALVILTAAAVFFGIADVSLRNTPAAQNSALVDVGATAQATQQLGDALKAAYSYDFARLDQNEAAATAGIVPDSTFMTQYRQLFGQVRQLAPAQQAVVTATVSTSAVREITGDRAVVVFFLDQQITRVATGNQAQQQAAAARLTATGRLVDGVWKIADLQIL